PLLQRNRNESVVSTGADNSVRPQHSNFRNSCFGVEASLKYFLLSAFSSGVLLFWFSVIYLQTGLSVDVILHMCCEVTAGNR
ncbi:hypothetical protein NY593_20745, partial [Enterobacter asburiae]|uniref:proton-conducting transporter transmembrane domain-containing protein n=1 Tax=Enterobacter asburiae TaxID=61645 RepID=UPI0022F077AE